MSRPSVPLEGVRTSLSQLESKRMRRIHSNLVSPSTPVSSEELLTPVTL